MRRQFRHPMTYFFEELEKECLDDRTQLLVLRLGLHEFILGTILGAIGGGLFVGMLWMIRGAA